MNSQTEPAVCLSLSLHRHETLLHSKEAGGSCLLLLGSSRKEAGEGGRVTVGAPGLGKEKEKAKNCSNNMTGLTVVPKRGAKDHSISAAWRL